MPQKRLTAAMVERISPPAKGQVEYWDKNMPGFGLRVSYKGTKSWVLMTRCTASSPGSRLGEWPTVTLADAHAPPPQRSARPRPASIPREVERERQSEADEARAAHLRRHGRSVH
jgi:hypothetical protein